MTRKIWVVLLGLFGTASAFAEDNDFLDDYSLLQPVPGEFVEAKYLHPNIVQRLADYKAVLVDQPEIFIADDSKYKGAKGDQLKALADVARLSVLEQLEAGGYTVADGPGPDVLYMRWAVTDLYLQKKKRGFLSYTPIGMVVHATKNAAVRDLWKKIDIVELSVEIEFSDLVTGEVIAAAVSSQQGLRKDKDKDQDAQLVSWQQLDALFETVGARITCVLTQSGRPQSEWETCAEIWIEPEEPEDD